MWQMLNVKIKTIVLNHTILWQKAHIKYNFTTPLGY